MGEKDCSDNKTDTRQHANNNKQSSQTKPRNKKSKLEYYTQEVMTLSTTSQYG